MAKRPSKTHELIRERLSADAISEGRKIYLSSAVRELRIDVRRRRFSAIIDGEDSTTTVKIEHGKDGPTWICSADGRNHTGCAHVAAILTAIREREASEGPSTKSGDKAKESLVDHLMENADRGHLIQAFKLCLRTYPELQGDLVFTILENIDADGQLYDEVVSLMDDPTSSEDYTLPKDGFDPYRLLDEINYLYEQEKYKQSFLLSRAILTQLLQKMSSGKNLMEHEVDLVIASSGMLSDLTIPPVPEQLAEQVHGLGMKLLQRFPKLEPQVQSSLIALLDDSALDQSEIVALEKTLRSRWERARKKEDGAEHAERLAMPLALFYARTRQFGKLHGLFDSYLQNPLLRAPALAEMLHHQLHYVVVKYVEDALVVPGEDTLREDHEDMARCGMYNDLVMMLVESEELEGDQRDLLRKAFMSVGHRIYGILDVYKEHVGEEVYLKDLAEIADEIREPASRGVYVSFTKYFVVLCELGRFEEAFKTLDEQGVVDPVILLDYLPNFLPLHKEALFEPAIQSIVELLPLVAEDMLRELVSRSITTVWDINEAESRNTLNRHFLDIVDEELADFVDLLLGDFDSDELGL
ncbi:MAG: hypothetical protein AB8F78_00030 [Saprospiraceae bacterium]